MAKIKKKKNKNSTVKDTEYGGNYYTKFKKVELISNGIITLCQATTIDGVAENFCWDSKKQRDIVRNNTLPDAEIIVGKSVTKGWDYV